MFKRFWVLLLEFVIGLAGNLIAGWIQADIWSNFFTPERLIVTIVSVIVIFPIIVWLERRDDEVKLGKEISNKESVTTFGNYSPGKVEGNYQIIGKQTSIHIQNSDERIIEEISKHFDQLHEWHRGVKADLAQTLQEVRERKAESNGVIRLELAMKSLADGNPAKAKQLIESLLVNFNYSWIKDNDTKIEARRLRSLGALAFISDSNSAQNLYAKAVELEPEDTTGWLMLGYVARRFGLRREASEAFETVLKISRQTGNIADEAAALAGLGLLQKSIGNLQKAIELVQSANRQFEKLNDQYALAIGYGNLGSLLGQQGDLFQADNYLKKGLQIATKLELERQSATMMADLGNIAVSQGNTKLAQLRFEEALKIHKKYGHKEGIAITLSNLSNLMMMLHDLNGAEKLALESLEIEKELKRTTGIALSLFNLAEISMKLSKFERAEKFAREAIDVFDIVGDESMKAEAHVKLGAILVVRRKLKEAYSEFVNAKEAFERIGDKHKIKAVDKLITQLL